MTASQRAWHRWIWLALPPAMLLLLAVSILFRNGAVP